MLALIAAILFILGLIFALADAAVGQVITVDTLTLAGLACAALHLAGIGTTWRVRR